MSKSDALIPQIKSAAIRRAAEIAANDGNSVGEIQTAWSRLNEVVAMNSPLTDNVREKISTELPGLRYYIADKLLHYQPDEGFVSDADKSGISFPIA